MPSTAFSDWETKLAAEGFGRLWLRKFRFDIDNGNVPHILGAIFEDAIERALVKLGAYLSPLEVLQSAICDNPTLFDLRGVRTPLRSESYSLIVRLEVFAFYYLSRRVFATIVDENEDDLNFIWTNINVLITSRFYVGRLRTDRGFFWCALTKTLEKVISKHQACKAATILRNRLGLHLTGKGQRLIRIDIPNSALAGKRICAPTTLDAGINPAFIPSHTADNYGRTLNLRLIRRDIREIVVEEIPFDETFGAVTIGKVGARVPSINWTDVEALIV